MFKAINGFTKEKIIKRIEREFKGKSVNKSDVCVYRGPRGKKCAVGMFIPDELYDKEMDDDRAQVDTRISVILSSFSNLKKFMPLSIEGLEEFQDAHDSLPEFDKPKHQKQELIDWVKRNVKN